MMRPSSCISLTVYIVYDQYRRHGGDNLEELRKEYGATEYWLQLRGKCQGCKTEAIHRNQTLRTLHVTCRNISEHSANSSMHPSGASVASAPA